MTEVSLCMIVKDEERFIETAVEPLSDLFDNIVIVDTGSSDNTVDIVRNMGIEPFFDEFSGDFARARNYALSHCNSGWIVSLDADEVFDQMTAKNILSFLKSKEPSSPTGFNVFRNNFFSNGAWYTSRELKIFSNTGIEEYSGNIAESVSSSIVNNGGKIEDINYAMSHFGHTRNRKIRDEKAKRYLEAFRYKLRNNPNDWKALGVMGLIARSIGRREEALEYIRNALRIQENAFTSYCMGQVLRFEMPIEAKLFYRKSLRYKHDILVLNLLGVTCLLCGEVGEAKDIFLRAVNEYPFLDHLRINLAISHCLSGEVEAAKAIVDELVSNSMGFGQQSLSIDHDPYQFEMYDTLSSYGGLTSILNYVDQRRR